MLDLLRLLGLLNPAGHPNNIPLAMDSPQEGSITGNQYTPDQGVAPSPIGQQNSQLGQILGLGQSHDASDRLKALLNTMPQRADYQPTTGDRVGAIAAKLSVMSPQTYDHGAALGFNSNAIEGQKLSESALNSKYNKAMGDWETKLKPINELAGIEKAGNTNDRLVTGQIMRDQNADAERERRTNKDEADIQSRKDSLAQKDRYLAFKKHQAEHPNHIYKTDKEGNVYSVNPQTDEVDYLQTDEGELIKADKLPEAEKIKINQSNALERIGAQGDESRKTGAQRDSAALERVKEGGNQARETGEQRDAAALERKKVPSSGSSSLRPLTPAAEKTAKSNKALQIINEDPDLKKFFVIGSNKLPTGELKPSGSWLFSDQNGKDYERAKSLFLGNDTKTKATKREDGKTKVKRKSDGKTGWVTNPDMNEYELVP